VSAVNSRSSLLNGIRRALASAQPGPVHVPRSYDREPSCGPGDANRFTATVMEYRAQVVNIEAGDIGATVASLLQPGTRVAVPADIPHEWTAGIDTAVDDLDRPLSTSELDSCDAVVTGCALAIAATGTIVLDTGPRQGRRILTLIPDHHICVVFAEQIVDTVPQAFAALDPTRPLTFISGPSATSDIELIRVEGVHGPRTLDVLLVSDDRNPFDRNRLHGTHRDTLGLLP